MADANAGKIPVLECVRASWSFLARHWQRFVPAAVIVAIAAQVGLIVVYLGGPPQEARSALQAAITNLTVQIPAILAGLLFTAAVLRKAVRDEFIGRTGLAAGADEIRLLGVVLSLSLMFIPIVVLASFILSATLLSKLTPEQAKALMDGAENSDQILIQALGEGGATMFVLLVLFAVAVCFVIFVRLLMVNAATIGERRIVIFQVWGWSRGNVLRMVGAFLLTWLPVLMFTALIGNVMFLILGSMPEGGRNFVVLVLVNAVGTFAATLASIPVTALGAVLYKGLRPQGFVAK